MLAILKKRYLVEGMQYRLMAAYFLYLCALVLVFYGAIFTPLIMTLDSSHLPDTQRDEAAKLILALHSRVWLGLPVILAICMMHSVLVSHRIAGPLHRFKRIFRCLGRGDLSFNVRLRQRDYLWNEAHAINEMVAALAQRIDVIKANQHSAGETLTRLAQAINAHSPADAEVLAGKLGTELDQMGRHLGEFKTTSTPIEAVPEPVAAPREPVAQP